MKTKTLLLLLAVAGVMFIASCKKDDPNPLTKDEAQAELTSVTTEFTDIKGAFDNSDAGLMQSTIDEMSMPFDLPMKSPASSKGFKDDLMKMSKPAFAKTTGDYGPFIYIDWDTNVGTWTWNESTSSWEHTTTPTDKIVVVFPYKDGTATLTYYDYATKSYTYDSETYTYVSSLKFKAEYTVSSTTTTVFSWTYSASRSGSSIGNLKITYTLGDFSQTESYSISVSTDGSTYYKLSVTTLFEVTYQGEVVFGQYATFAGTESQSGYSVKISAKVKVKSVVIKWDISWNNETNKDNPNNFMKVSVWTTGGAKIADVVMILEGEEYVPYFEYADGTQEKVSDKLGSGEDENSLMYLLGEFIDNIMNIMNILK